MTTANEAAPERRPQRSMPKDPWTMSADEYQEWDKSWTPSDAPEKAEGVAK